MGRDALLRVRRKLRTATMKPCLSLASLYNLLVKTPFHIKQRFK